MRYLAIQRVLGLLLMLFSSSLLPPLAVSFWYGDHTETSFLSAFALVLGLGVAIWLPVARVERELRGRDGFVIVVMFWVVLGGIGAVPLMLSENPQVSVTDALFESISALTTTGATVLVGLDEMPRSILFYRQELQWLGGIGIIVLAVAVLPILGVGGMQLYKAEAPGPVKDSKLTPRITETAKALWYLYLGLTVACAVAYWLAGMTLFDAVGHAFSTVAIGGFSTHDASMGYFDSRLIDSVAIVFMLLAGANFALHFTAWRGLTLRPYLGDPEFRLYIGLFATVAAITSVMLYVTSTFITWDDAIIQGVFQAVSIGTTTGFTTADYHLWPGFITILLLMTSFIGGCAGSTGGGIKVVRFLLLIRQGAREITRLIHPNAQVPVRLGGVTISQRTVDAVWGFFALYVASFSVMYLLLALTGLDLMTSFSAVAACLNNLGPGLGLVGSNYQVLPDAAKWVLCFAMLLGRLEIFTLLVLFTPAFWRP
ncbi:MAG: TrkH family potassium uptake protein [Chromatiales bacterium]|nr:TrkH family potassium uptake protein [Chromatiales bacterium]